MKRVISGIVCLLAIGLLHTRAVGQVSTCLPDGVQSSGAIYRICMPPDALWNGDLVIYAHGYVAITEPVAIPEDQLAVNDVYLPELVNALGYAFATTSYSVNGLAIPEALADVVELVDIFSQQIAAPNRVYIVGASEGGLVTTLAVELYPDIFDGGVAACAPSGSFRSQINYYGDFRVVFDYFFPGLLPGTVEGAPLWLYIYFDIYYEYYIKPVLAQPQNLAKLLQLISVTKIPFDPANLNETLDKSLRDALWYNSLGTADAIAKLGGQPFGNQVRLYSGSLNDAALNAGVQRVTPSPTAAGNIATFYETTGDIGVPLVTLHTLLDQQTPYWHMLFYALKIQQQGRQDLYTHLPVLRYGHCNFNGLELVLSFAIMVNEVTQQETAIFGDVLSDPDERLEFMARYRQAITR